MGGVVDAVKDIVKGIVKVVVGVVKAVVNFVGDVIGFVINPFGALDTPQVPDPGSEAQGVQVTKQGTNVAVPVVYGFRRVGGSNIFTETNGTSNKYLYVVYALCEGEIEGVGRILINDVELPKPSGGKYTHGQTYTITSTRYKDRIKLQVFNGTEGQGQSSLANESASWGKKQRKLPGLAYAVIRYEWKEIKTQEDADNNPFSGGIPQAKFDVYGKKVYDVRTHGGGLNLSGSYSSRSKSYQINPASCLLDYLENSRYGVGLSTTEINADTFKIAANKYEQTVRYSNRQSGRALTLNAVVGTDQKVLDNVKALTAGCRGIMPFIQGRYKLKVEDGGNATDISSTSVNVAYDVDKSEIIGGISLTGERKGSKYNQVIVNYIDPDKDFTNQQVVHDVDGDQTIDNDELLTGEFTFHTLTNKAIARDLAQMIYDKSRKQRTISFQASQELLEVEVGDIIRVTDTVLDLNLDTFRVVGSKLRPDGLVDIEATEHDATLYPFTTGEQINIDPPLYRPDEFYIGPYVRNVPTKPIGIFPPIDPDDPTQDNPLPPEWDDPDPSVTQFEIFTQAVTPTYSLRGIYIGYAQADGTSPLLYYPSGSPYRDVYDGNFGVAKFEDLGFARQYKASIICPIDTSVDFLVFRYYLDGELFFDIGQDGEILYPLRDPNHGHGTIDGSRLDTIFNTGNHHPMTIKIGLPTQPGVTCQVRWRKSSLGMEFPDGSIVSSEFSNYTYQIPDGTTRTGRNLEAFINYLIDNTANGGATSFGGKQDLGA